MSKTLDRCAWPGSDADYVAYHDDEWGVPEYDDLTECVVSMLQVQADHEAKERGNL